MDIVVVTPEAVPYIKTGGLADAAGSLYSALSRSGNNAFMFVPFYKDTKVEHTPVTVASGLKLVLGERRYYFTVLSQGNVFFVANDYFFHRDGLYGDGKGDFPDNAERFAFFTMAVLQTVKLLGIEPDIFHLHDWQTSLLAYYHKRSDSGEDKSSIVFTIHNLGYQGLFSPDILPRIGIPRNHFTLESFEFYGKVNMMKAGIVYSDTVTTVSPSYAAEITSPRLGFGLEGILKRKGVTGILNGLDYEEWNPASDRALKMNFDEESLGGKTACKSDVSSLAGFRDPALPLIGIIGRLTTQKGFDVVAECVDAILKLNVNLIILGRGDPEIEKKLSHALSPYPGRAHLESRFDETLARKIYAGSDMFLMPSRFEPCGLAQMIAMRYGSVPIVSATGGLKDTVSDFNSGNFDGTGFVFRETNADIVVECTKRALCTFRNEGDWNRILHNAMSSRFFWEDSTRKYLDLYSSLKREHSGEYKK